MLHPACGYDPHLCCLGHCIFEASVLYACIYAWRLCHLSVLDAHLTYRLLIKVHDANGQEVT